MHGIHITVLLSLTVCYYLYYGFDQPSPVTKGKLKESQSNSQLYTFGFQWNTDLVKCILTRCAVSSHQCLLDQGAIENHLFRIAEPRLEDPLLDFCAVVLHTSEILSSHHPPEHCQSLRGSRSWIMCRINSFLAL